MITCFTLLLFIQSKAQNNTSLISEVCENEFVKPERWIIKINNQLATYEQLLKIPDSAILKIMVFRKNTTRRRNGFYDDMKDAIFLTTRNIKVETYTTITNQDSSKFYINNNDTVFLLGGTKPFFEGDATNRAWRNFISKNLNSNKLASEGAPKGIYVVMCHFIINKYGRVSDLKIAEDPGFGAGTEVIKLMTKANKWKPATYFGKQVTYQMSQKFIFNVSE